MARGDMDITIHQNVRPCMIFEFLSGGPFDGGEREETWSKGLWHRWIKQKKTDSVYVRPGKYKKVMQDFAYALIERQDGRVELIEASRVKFIDNPFADYSWPEEESNEDRITSKR